MLLPALTCSDRAAEPRAQCADPDFAVFNTQASPTWRGTASRQVKVPSWSAKVCPLAAPPWGDTSGLALPWAVSRVLPSGSHRHRFDPIGLGITSCDRVTSTEVCHNETHIPEWHPLYIEDQCVFDDEDGECCFTQKNNGREGYREEKCRYYDLDNYTLTALVESGDEEYQHFQNATGHWVRRLSKCPLRSQKSLRSSWASVGGLAA